MNESFLYEKIKTIKTNISFLINPFTHIFFLGFEISFLEIFLIAQSKSCIKIFDLRKLKMGDQFFNFALF